MSKNMVERVARALAVADGKDPDAPAWVVAPGEPYGVCWRDQYANKARAAIEAMAEPTEEMVAEGTRVHWGAWDGDDGRENVEQIWPAMITAALKP